MSEIKNWKTKPKEILGGILTASIIFLGVASCNSGGGEEAANTEAANPEDVPYVTGADNEGLANNESGEFNEFNELDTNEDELLDETEFETVANEAGIYDEWDADDDGFLSDDELNDGVYGVYDENDDGVYSNEEFGTWNTAWGGEYDFEAWDKNGDGILDADEFSAGTEEAGVFDDWDADNDGLFAENEMYDGLYDTWDENDNGNLNKEELNAVGYKQWGF